MKITGYWQLEAGRRPYTIVNHEDRLEVPGYSHGYFAFCSVAGMALEDHDDVYERIKDARKRGHKPVWVNALCSIIDCSGRTGAQKAMDGAPKEAKLHRLDLGSLVWFEGHAYRLERDWNKNIRLDKVTVWVDDNGKITIKEGKKRMNG